MNLDQKQLGFPEDVLPSFLRQLGVGYHIIEKDAYSIVTDKIAEKKYCGLCPRLRRGILYGFANKIGLDKIPLDHHREDVIETLFFFVLLGKTASHATQIALRSWLQCGDQASCLLS